MSRIPTPRSTCVLGAVALVSLAAALPALAIAQRRPTDPLVLERGDRVYRAHCATCHGRRGDGRGPSADLLDPAPRDFTRGVYKWRTTPSGALPTDRDLVRSVRRGAPGTSMPAWAGRIPDADILAVVQRIQAFARRFRDEPIPAPVALPRTTPRLDAEARRSGRAMYALMQCWTCHGVRGRGDGPAAATLRDDRGRRIDAYDFTRGAFRSGGLPLDVYRTFTTGVNGTPMPAYEETLPPSEANDALSDAERARRSSRLRWDLVAYVLALAEGSPAWRWLTTPLYQTG